MLGSSEQFSSDCCSRMDPVAHMQHALQASKHQQHLIQCHTWVNHGIVPWQSLQLCPACKCMLLCSELRMWAWTW